MLWIICICIGAAALLYYGLLKPHRFWKDQGAPHETPWLLFGSIPPLMHMKQSMPDFWLTTYKKYSEKRYALLYIFLTPVLFVKDLDLIKRILVKEFDSFPDHTMISSEEEDPIWAKNLFSMKGAEQWKDIRHVLSPAFTANKLKIMFELLMECAGRFTQHFVRQGDFNELDTNDAFRRIITDIIATAAFGVNCDSWGDRDNEFFLMGKSASDLSGIKILKWFVVSISPILTKLLKIRLVDEKTSSFFRKLIKDTINVREKYGTIRPDMLHLMLEARKGRLKFEENESIRSFAETSETNIASKKPVKTEITDEIITAQAAVFFLAGLDSTARAMSFATYELALNPDIQNRLRSELVKTLEECNGKMTYDSLLGMKYLDMVISESLRKWPPSASTDRFPVRSFTIEPQEQSETHVTVNSKVVVLLPILPIHRDPDYYPNPDIFDPERFSDENKHKIKPFTYLPFGGGPRNCIGSRFALLQMKILLFHIVSEFEIVPIEKTQIPLIFSKSNLMPFPEKGFWVSLKRVKV